MKRKISFWLYVCAMALLVCWLFFSTSILAYENGMAWPKKIDFSTVKDALQKDTVYYNLEKNTFGNTLFDEFSFSGYAFVETEQKENPYRYTSFILKSEDNCYECYPKSNYRREVPNAMNLLGLVARGDYLGFVGEFSTLRLKDGLYDIYIYCKENEQNYGMSDTGYQLFKGPDGIALTQWESEKISNSLQLTDSSEIAIGNIELVIIDKGFFTASGWCAARDMDSHGQTVYLRVTNSVGEVSMYSTKSLESEDVVEYFSSDLYGQCRFKASVPEAEINDGLYTVSVYLVNGDKVLSSIPYYVLRNGNNVLYGAAEAPETAEIIVGSLERSELQPEYKEALHYLEQDGSYTSLSLVQAPAVAEGQRVLLKLNMEDGGEKYLFCQPDSTRLPGAFRLTVPGDIMPELESYQVCTTDGALLYVNEDRIVPALNGEKIPQEALSAYDPSRFTEPQIAQAEIMEDGCLLVSGWTIVQGEDSGDETHYIRLDYPDKSTAFIRALTVYRPDVSIYLGDGRYDWSGFYALIGPEYLDPQPETFTVATDTGDALLIAQNVYSAQPDGSR